MFYKVSYPDGLLMLELPDTLTRSLGMLSYRLDTRGMYKMLC